MAITRTQAQVTSYFGNSASPSFTLASPPLENDVIFFGCQVNSFRSVTEPSGWVNPYGAGVEHSTAAHVAFVLYHVVTAGEAAASTVTWTLTNVLNTNDHNRHVVAVYRGLDTAAPVTPSPQVTIVDPVASSADIPFMEGDNLETGGKLIAIHAMDSSTTEGTAPAGWTRVVVGTSEVIAFYEYDSDTTAGVDVAAATITGTGSDEQIVMALGLAPEPVAPSFTGSFIRIAGGAKSRVRMAAGTAASLRLSSGSRLED